MVKKNVANLPPILKLFNETFKSSIEVLKRIGDKIPPCLINTIRNTKRWEIGIVPPDAHFFGVCTKQQVL